MLKGNQLTVQVIIRTVSISIYCVVVKTSKRRKKNRQAKEAYRQSGVVFTG